MSDNPHTMPAVFVGHGSPMTAFEDNPYVTSWRTLGERLPRPRAILAISAHWYIDGAAVTAGDQPETVHDFYGFPEALYRFRYPAPGSPALASRVIELLAPEPVTASDRWGLDHGAWTVLMHAFPKADVPVVQLSVDRRKSPAEHMALAERLRPLRDEGVLVMATGNIVHNLRLYDPRGGAAADPVAEGFRKAVQAKLLAHDHAALADYLALSPQARLAAPTPDHFLPLLYIAALQDDDEAPTFFNEVTEGGGVDMTSVLLGAESPSSPLGRRRAPRPKGVGG
ncbi:MAG: 4,5-DOPA dioxygenase extradiol [Caulobacteraceae bacterium]